MPDSTPTLTRAERLNALRQARKAEDQQDPAQRHQTLIEELAALRESYYLDPNQFYLYQRGSRSFQLCAHENQELLGNKRSKWLPAEQLNLYEGALKRGDRIQRIEKELARINQKLGETDAES
jgi:hypothetical protein